MTEPLHECPCCHESDNVTWDTQGLIETEHGKLDLPVVCECGCEWGIHLTEHCYSIDKQPEPPPKLKRYNHAFSLGFSIEVEDDPEGDNITARALRDAIVKRADDLLNDGEMHEAVGAPFDSYDVDTLENVDPSRNRGGT